jgi:hypothetical protein
VNDDRRGVILVEGDRLVRIGKDVSTVFDLKARRRWSYLPDQPAS